MMRLHAKRIVATVATVALATACSLPLSACSSMGSRLGGLLDNGPSLYGSTFTAAERGERPDITVDARDHYTDVSSASDATVLVYIVGSDLESQEGAATEDINEMLAAKTGENVNVLIQTGGATQWSNPLIESGTARYSMSNGQLNYEDSLGKLDMCKTSTLTDFIKWGVKTAPADRYELILWDHGGGTMAGFGYDEYYEQDDLSIADISSAVKSSGATFDFIAFDACLMGTIETAYSFENYADYFIGSEESEAGYGWYYTNWLAALEKDPSIDTVELAKTIIDDYISGPDASVFDGDTLSIIDLAEVDWLSEQIETLMNNCAKALDSDYSTISAARANAKAFGDGEYDQIDIVDFCDRVQVEGYGTVAAGVEHIVKYSSASTGVAAANGLAMYFPYVYPAYYSEVKDILSSIDYPSAITDFYDTFVTIKAAGSEQFGDSDRYGYSSSGIFGYDISSLFGSSWYDSSTADSYDYSSTDTVDDTTLTLTDKGSYYALSLSDEQWESIVGAQLMVMLDDGEGYIDLGTSDTYEFDSDNDLIVDFDGNWVSLNGQVVPFYSTGTEQISSSEWSRSGYVQAELNGQTDIQIMLYWDNDTPNGKVLGYCKAAEDDASGAGVQGKRYLQFKNGDTIDFYCDCYTYSGSYDGEYYIGDQITYNGSLKLSTYSLSDESLVIGYVLTDIYGANYYTEWVEL